MDAVWPYLAAILPTILVAILFYFLIKSMLEGDRRERLAQRRFEAEEDRRHAAQAARTPLPPAPKGPDEAGFEGPTDSSGKTSSDS